MRYTRTRADALFAAASKSCSFWMIRNAETALRNEEDGLPESPVASSVAAALSFARLLLDADVRPGRFRGGGI